RERRGPGLHALVQLAPGVVLREPLVLGLEQDAAGRGALGGAELDQRVALLAAALGLGAAGVRGDVAARASDALERRVYPLLEHEALAGPRLLGLGHPLVGALALHQARQLLPQLRDLRLHRAGLARVALAQALDLLAVALLGLQDRLAEALLDRDEGVGAVLRREHPQKRLHVIAGATGDDLADLRLDRLVAAEGARDRLGHRLAALLERGLEPAVELAEARLELAAHVVHVDGRLLGVEDAGPDLDRLADRLRRGLPGLRALAHDAGGALVGQLEALDDEPVADRADGARRLAAVHLELGILGCFHGSSRR